MNAASFAILGTSDEATRLSDLVLASLLVMAVYRLGWLAGGHRPAMAAAIVVNLVKQIIARSPSEKLGSTRR